MARKRKPSGPTRAANEVVQIGVRLEEQLRRRLERAAKHRGRSMNTEIVQRLLRSFQSAEEKDKLIAQAIIDAYPDIATQLDEIFWQMRGDDAEAERYDDEPKESE